MATIITSECINCGACEPECPNTAIYAGGATWELSGESHPAIAQDIFYIVAVKCTECVGFYDHEACAAVCPVDCCVPDPNNLESEEVLIKRARQLHPEQSFAADFPSRFRKAGAQAPSDATGSGVAATGAADGPAPAAEPKPVPAAAPASQPAPAAVRATQPASVAAPAAQPAPAAARAPQPASSVAGPSPARAPEAAAPPAAATQPAPAAAQVAAGARAPSPEDEFNPITWQVPVICKDCKERYTVPYRHLEVGVVFHCPHCMGSFVPTSAICRMFRETFEKFYGRRRRARELFERRGARELAQFEAAEAAQKEAFEKQLEEMARNIKPAGKLVRPTGIASMFT